MNDPRLPEPALRVVFAAAGVGAGHTRAGAAVRSAMQQQGRLAQHWNLDVLEHAPSWFVRLYRDGYLATVRRLPWVVGAGYARSDLPLRSHSAMGRTVARAEDAILKRFRSLDCLRVADAVVSTHFLASSVLARMRQRGQLQAKLVTVITDEHPHAIWLHAGSDLTCVASKTARMAAIQRGLDPARVVVTGIPVDPSFCMLAQQASPPGADEREHHVLLCGGGHGLGSMQQAARSLLAEQRAQRLRARVTVVCGRNSALQHALLRDRDAAGVEEDRFTIVGFTDVMHQLMASATLLIGKPGGLTCTEAMAVGLPMLMLKPIPGQEERNAQALEGAGAAIRLAHASQVGAEAVRVLTHPLVLRSMRAAAAATGKPRAAFDVAHHVAVLTQSAVLATADCLVRQKSASW